MSEYVPKQPCPVCRAKLPSLNPSIEVDSSDMEFVDQEDRIVCVTVCRACLTFLECDMKNHTVRVMPQDNIEALDNQPIFQLMKFLTAQAAQEKGKL